MHKYSCVHAPHCTCNRVRVTVIAHCTYCRSGDWTESQRNTRVSCCLLEPRGTENFTAKKFWSDSTTLKFLTFKMPPEPKRSSKLGGMIMTASYRASETKFKNDFYADGNKMFCNFCKHTVEWRKRVSLTLFMLFVGFTHTKKSWKIGKFATRKNAEFGICKAENFGP